MDIVDEDSGSGLPHEEGPQGEEVAAGQSDNQIEDDGDVGGQDDHDDHNRDDDMDEGGNDDNDGEVDGESENIEENQADNTENSLDQDQRVKVCCYSGTYYSLTNPLCTLFLVDTIDGTADS
jgi:hypothetical protein